MGARWNAEDRKNLTREQIIGRDQIALLHQLADRLGYRVEPR